MTDVDDETDGSQYRRLPLRVPPASTGYDVSTPAPVSEVKYVSGLSPAGSVEGYKQLADYLTSTPRASGRRTAVLVILGLGLLALALSQAM